MELEPKCRKIINIIQWSLIGLCLCALFILHINLKKANIVIEQKLSDITEYQYIRMSDINTIRYLKLENIALRDSIDILKSDMENLSKTKRKK